MKPINDPPDIKLNERRKRLLVHIALMADVALSVPKNTDHALKAIRESLKLYDKTKRMDKDKVDDLVKIINEACTDDGIAIPSEYEITFTGTIDTRKLNGCVIW